MYLHEIVMYSEHQTSDFVAPYSLEHVGPSKGSLSTGVTSPQYDVCLSNLISSAHALLCVFLSLDVETVRILPITNYFRVVYAALILTKLKMSALDPRSDLGKTFPEKDLNTDYYRTAVMEKLEGARGPYSHPLPSLFLDLLTTLGRNWAKHVQALQTRSTGGPRISMQSLDEMGSRSLSLNSENGRQGQALPPVLNFDSSFLTPLPFGDSDGAPNNSFTGMVFDWMNAEDVQVWNNTNESDVFDVHDNPI